jgi:MFS transporter, DHA2 family, multidrug resistance protein
VGATRRLRVTAARAENPAIASLSNPHTPSGRAALDWVDTQQAQIIAYPDDYQLLLVATLAVLPLLLVFRRPASPVAGDGS